MISKKEIKEIKKGGPVGRGCHPSPLFQRGPISRKIAEQVLERVRAELGDQVADDLAASLAQPAPAGQFT